MIFLALHHFDEFNDLGLPKWDGLMQYFSEGFLSVNFFFMLSGFVVALNYTDKLRDNIISNGRFLFLRIAHLWPTYLLGLAAVLVAICGVNAVDQFKYPIFWCQFFMVQSLIPNINYAFSYNAAAWAVSTEFFFYILFICVVKLDESTKRKLTAGLWGIIVLISWIEGCNSPIAGWMFYINPVFRFADFMTGVCLSDLYKHGLFEPDSKKSATILECFAVFLLGCFVIIGANGQISMLWKWQIFYTPAVAFLIYVFSFNKGGISKLLSGRVFAFLGRISYPFYIFHQIAIKVIKQVLLPWITSANRALLAGCLAILVSVIVSIPVTLLFTEPLNKWLRKQKISPNT